MDGAQHGCAGACLAGPGRRGAKTTPTGSSSARGCRGLDPLAPQRRQQRLLAGGKRPQRWPRRPRARGERAAEQATHQRASDAAAPCAHLTSADVNACQRRPHRHARARRPESPPKRAWGASDRVARATRGTRGTRGLGARRRSRAGGRVDRARGAGRASCAKQLGSVRLGVWACGLELLFTNVTPPPSRSAARHAGQAAHGTMARHLGPGAQRCCKQRAVERARGRVWATRTRPRPAASALASRRCYARPARCLCILAAQTSTERPVSGTAGAAGPMPGLRAEGAHAAQQRASAECFFARAGRAGLSGDSTRAAALSRGPSGL